MPTVSSYQETGSSVPSVGGQHVQISSACPERQVLMKFYDHHFQHEEGKFEYVTSKTPNKDMFAAEIAGLDVNYSFKNQTERRHVTSAWFKNINTAYNDKVKARNLYSAENRPSWWPQDVEYCSPTNSKKSGGKLTADELDKILLVMRQQIIHFLTEGLKRVDLSIVVQKQLPATVLQKLSAHQPARSRTHKTRVTRVETVVKQETGVIQQESEAMAATTNIAPTGSTAGYSVQPHDAQLHASSLPQPPVDFGGLSTINLDSIYQESGSASSGHCQVVAMLGNSDVVTIKQETSELQNQSANVVPTVVEDMDNGDELDIVGQAMLFTDLQPQAYSQHQPQSDVTSQMMTQFAPQDQQAISQCVTGRSGFDNNVMEELMQVRQQDELLQLDDGDTFDDEDLKKLIQDYPDLELTPPPTAQQPQQANVFSFQKEPGTFTGLLDGVDCMDSDEMQFLGFDDVENFFLTSFATDGGATQMFGNAITGIDANLAATPSCHLQPSDSTNCQQGTGAFSSTDGYGLVVSATNQYSSTGLGYDPILERGSAPEQQPPLAVAAGTEFPEAFDTKAGEYPIIEYMEEVQSMEF